MMNTTSTEGTHKMQQIRCETIEQFMQVIDGLVRAGLTFRADAGALVVDLLGGY